MGVYSTLTFGYSLVKPGISAARRSALSREPNRAMRILPWVEPAAEALVAPVAGAPPVAAGVAAGAPWAQAARTETPAAPKPSVRKRRRRSCWPKGELVM